MLYCTFDHCTIDQSKWDRACRISLHCMLFTAVQSMAAIAVYVLMFTVGAVGESLGPSSESSRESQGPSPK